MGSTYNIDYQKGATIVENPVDLEGKWGQLMCLSNCTGVDVDDQALTVGSLQWGDNEFIKGAIIVGLFTRVTFTGRVVLYA